MDIEYLLTLQQLRAQLGGVFENVMLGFSFIADGPLLVALALILYWCVDKRTGLFAIFCMGAANFVSQLLKNIFCIYRPWVQDTRIIPSEGAIEGAGGYSLPSGHTTGVTSVFGSIAWLNRRKHKVLVVACILIIAIIAFSRNFLGVHTPQDVIVGFIVALTMIALTNGFLNWMERSDAMTPGHSKDIAVTVVLQVLCIASVIFVVLKAYPMDYVDGVLLVDPVDMQKGSFEAAGMLGGLSLGWLLERRLVGFETGPDVGVGERVVRGIVGVAIVGIVYVGTGIAFDMIMPHIWAKLFGYYLLTLFAMFVAPLLFKVVQRVFRPERKSRGAHAQ